MSKRILSMLLVLVMLLGIVPTGVLATEAMTLTVGANLPEANATFKVVDYKNHDDSNNATSAVIHIPATDDDVAPISMEAQLINYRMADEPDVSGMKNPFTDVPTEAWYNKAVIWAFNEGVVTGAPFPFSTLNI